VWSLHDNFSFYCYTVVATKLQMEQETEVTPAKQMSPVKDMAAALTGNHWVNMFCVPFLFIHYICMRLNGYL